MNYYKTSIQQAISEACHALKQHNDSPHSDALLLLQHASNKSKEYLIAHSDEALDHNTYQHYQNLLARRMTGEPIAYIIQQKEFWSLPLNITPGVLIPRPESELLIEATLDLIDANNAINILDLGTGSGCIALALANELPYATITATDNSKTCITQAKQNARTLELDNVHFVLSNWFENILQNDFDIIISNPPYISSEDTNIEQAVKAFEPHSALYSDSHGLADLFHIIQHASEYLISDGRLLLEHGYQQAQPVRTQLEKIGYNDIHSLKDLQQYERVTTASLPH